MRFRILGPVELWRDGVAVPIVGEKQRTLLAQLLLHAGQVARHDELLAVLWGDEPPGAGRKALHNHLWSLRRLIGDGGELITTAGGYALRIPAGELDLAVFAERVETAGAHRAAGRVAEAAGELHAALALWRGAALGGTRQEFQAGKSGALEERRMAALADRVDADLELGRHAELIGELRRLVDGAPLDERFRAQLMLALHRAGRRADALQQYRLARTTLRDELGLEPGRALSELHQWILTADGTQDRPRGVGTRQTLVPRQLPADVVRFTGRKRSLDELDELLSGALMIAAVAGAGGVGKTALATRWGHRSADRFPDGQLYVDLRGYSPGPPVEPGQALHQLLRGLGVPADEIPHETDERAGMYRSLVAGRRMLFLFDNAASADQVRPLLPGSAEGRTLITSRHSLLGLAVTHDAGFLHLDVLPAREAEELLVALLGAGQDTDAVAELARLCSGLPLALRLAAAHVRGHAGMSVAEFAHRLRDGNRLAELDIDGDPHIGVRAAFALSYRSLLHPARQAFRLAGLHPGPDLCLEAVAAMTGQAPEATRHVVGALVRAHLVHRDERGRLSMHDLIREYAREQVADDGERRQALTRLLDWHTHTTRSAMSWVDPDANLIRPTVEEPAGGVPEFAGGDSALAWLAAEHRNWVALVELAAGDGWPVHAWQLAYTAAYHCYLASSIDDWVATQRLALTAVRSVGDHSGEAKVLTTLGHAHMAADQYAEFLDCQRQAVALARLQGERQTEAEALYYVGYGLHRTGRLAEALDACAQARELYQGLGDRPGEIAVIDTIGQVHLRLGDMGQAVAHLSTSLDHIRGCGRRHDEAHTLMHMGTAYAGLGDLPRALRCQEQALLISREIGGKEPETEALCRIGNIKTMQGRLAEALRHQEEALALARRLASRHLESMVLNGLGGTHAAAGDRDRARQCFGAALELARSIGDPYELAAARAGLDETEA
ncbi:AfsR/SARP family transcriptional regulator [Nonomuraea sp. LPB2021202275-12-8]|uniref:AfsR/SARP family transcriptional regulator n=1 Tax=Nonomuraea sp. LPB2021202275-12-8 TaxID=3120159 RepID=UPI00300C62CD